MQSVEEYAATHTAKEDVLATGSRLESIMYPTHVNHLHVASWLPFSTIHSRGAIERARTGHAWKLLVRRPSSAIGIESEWRRRLFLFAAEAFGNFTTSTAFVES